MHGLRHTSAAILILAAAIPSQVTSYVRTVSAGTVTRLECASVTFEDIEKRQFFTITATVDVADAAFYADRERELAAQDLVLHEAIDDVEDADDLLIMVARVQEWVGAYLGLAQRRNSLRFEGDRFLRADLTPSELRAELAERGLADAVPARQLLGAMGPLVEPALSILTPKQGKPLNALLLKAQDRLKSLLATVIGNGSAAYERFKQPQERLRDEAIIGARNARLMDVLVDRLSNSNPSRVAIVHGFSHCKDLEARLLRWRSGLKVIKVEWHPAWVVDLASAPRPELPATRDF